MFEKFFTSFKDATIKSKLTLVTLIPAVAAIVIVSITFLIYDIISSWHKNEDEMLLLATVTGEASRSSILFQDEEFAKSTLNGIVAKDDITAAGLYQKNGNIFVSETKDGSHPIPKIAQEDDIWYEDGHVNLFYSIRLQDEIVGKVFIRRTIEVFRNKVIISSLIAIFTMVILTIIVLAILTKFYAILSAPIRNLVEAMDFISKTESYTKEVEKYGNDELGMMIDSFNRMVHLLHQRDKKLAEYASSLETMVKDRTTQLLEANYKLKTELEHHKKTQEILRIAKEEAESASRAKSEFLANTSHELRTPLNTILGFSELILESGTLPTEDARKVELIKSSGESLLALINDILDLARIEAGIIKLEGREFSLSHAVEKAIDQYAVLAHNKKLELTLDIDSTGRKIVIADLVKLNQILSNLVSNAIKFTDIGEVIISVTEIGAKEGSTDNKISRFKFDVIDTGSGIPKDLLEKIFDRFTQADGALTRKHGGTGLGTTISKQLIENMGGSLSVTSKVDEGSTFSFILPFEVVRTLEESNGRNYQKLKGKNVLVITKYRTTLNVIGNILEGKGIKADLFVSIEEGLLKIRAGMNGLAKKYDLVVVDFNLEIMTGLELISTIVKLDKIYATRSMILLPTNKHISSGEGIYKNIPHLYKPVKRDEFINKALDIIELISDDPIDDTESQVTLKYVRNELTVLIVEDTEINQELIEISLSKLGIKTLLASNGKDAIDIWLKHNPDLILMDIQMPVMDGISATKQIRAIEKKENREHVPIVALTAHAMESDKQVSLMAGMDRYLAKPVKLNMLRNTIMELTNNSLETEIPSDTTRREFEIEIDIVKDPVYNLEGLSWLCGKDAEKLNSFIKDYKNKIDSSIVAIKTLNMKKDKEKLYSILSQTEEPLNKIEATRSKEMIAELKSMADEEWAKEGEKNVKKLLGELTGIKTLLEENHL